MPTRDFYNKDLAFAFLKKHKGATLSWERLGPLTDEKGHNFSRPNSATKPYKGMVRYTITYKSPRKRGR